MDAAMNPLRELRRLGQGVWLDDLSRELLEGGALARLVAQDGLSGVTSNPTIFEKAISGTALYDADLARAKAEAADAEARFERLAIPDIRAACDILRPVHEATGGDDGYASLEVSPRLAADEEATVAAALRLREAVGRENLLVKVPATEAGLHAFERLTGQGVGVNVTLMFSVAQVVRFAEAYMEGLRRLRRGGGDPAKVKSVASLFLSRVDTLVDRELEARGTPEALALRGKAAVALAKSAWGEYRRIFHGPAFAPLAAHGARPQYLLWASTGTKNPRYPDVHYIEPLVGRETVTTMPGATLAAFRDHGKAEPTLERGAEQARAHLAELARLGIDMDAAASTLQAEGVRLFERSYAKLLERLA